MYNSTILKSILILSIILLTSSLSFSKQLKVIVYDKDIEIPLEGVTVITKNPDNKVITDYEGVSFLEINDDQRSLTIVCMLVGYENKKVTVTNFNKDVKIELSISGVIEGKELVIEEKKADKKDEKPGVSTVVGSEMINTSAMVGPVEDIMSSIKTLPGVSYGGKFNAEPSVRGGDPSETTATLDGFLIRNPYHWGGVFSIFNPNMIDSVKFSNGIIPVKYGDVTSGLIEVNSVNPNEGLKFDGIFSTTTTEIFAQIPLWDWGKRSGLLVGTRQTYLDLLLSIIQKPYLDATGMNIEVTVFPYIRDGILKWFIKPIDRLEVYTNIFAGNDGVAAEIKDNINSNNRNVSYTTSLTNFRSNLIVSTGIKALPRDNIFIHFMGGYEMLYNEVKLSRTEKANIEDYDPINFDSGGFFYTLRHSLQSRLDVDFTLTPKIIFSCGTSLLYDYDTEHQEGNEWTFFSLNNPFNPSEIITVYQNVDFNLNSPYLNTFLFSTYINFNFIPIPGKLNIDLGIRGDYFFINGKILEFQTLPVVNPRFSIQYTPIRNFGYLKELTISGGIGLFSKVPTDVNTLKSEYGIEDFKIAQPQVLTSVLGLEILLPLEFKIKIEGYYKFYFHRFYMNRTINLNQTNNSLSYSNIPHSDGIGHAAGFDILVQRSLSRYIDGWISYSFIFAKHLNPNGSNTWVYPLYHRFHSLNIVLDIKPTNFLTITPKFTFATGIPKLDFGTHIHSTVPQIVSKNGKPLDIYTNSMVYNDELRNNVEFPFDLKVAFHFYFPKSKIRFEVYVAGEDLFVSFAVPNKNTSVDKYTGKEVTNAIVAYGIQFPIPSIGIKVNF